MSFNMPSRRSILSPVARAACVAAVAGLGGSVAHAALVTQTATDAAGQSSFNTGLHWSDSNPPAAGNSYSTGTGLSLRTPFDQATDIAFAGDSLSLVGTTASNAVLVIKNLTNTTTTVNNLTLDGGQIQNGGTSAGAATSVTLASNGITLGAGGGVLNAGTTGRVLTINAPIGGTGPLTASTSGGQVILVGTNNYVGNTTVTGSALAAGVSVGSLRANDGTQLSTGGVLTLNGGILQTGVDVTRVLGADVGQIQITGGVSGFSAVGADVTVALGGTAAPNALTWGNATFAPSFLVLNDAGATNALTFANALDLGTVARSIYTGANTATVSGQITDTGSLNVYGAGTLILSNASNSYSGGTFIGTNNNNTAGSLAGVVRATASGALGTGTITIGTNGNATLGRLELASGATLANAISLPARSTAGSVAIQNVSGNNELSGTISATSGGSVFIIQSDSGMLTLSGASAAAGGIAIQSATGGRVITLQGTGGNGQITGIVRDSNAVAGATIGITKAGSNTWTLSGNNSYTGLTSVNAGTLALGAADRIADADNMSLGGGTFATGGFNETLGTLALAASSSIDLGNGASVVHYAASNAATWTGTLTINNWSGNPSGGGIDQLFFGNSTAGLTAAQLNQIQFTGYSAGAQILSTGEVVPLVPEPASLVALGLLGVFGRRRRA